LTPYHHPNVEAPHIDPDDALNMVAGFLYGYDCTGCREVSKVLRTLTEPA